MYICFTQAWCQQLGTKRYCAMNSWTKSLHLRLREGLSLQHTASSPASHPASTLDRLPGFTGRFSGENTWSVLHTALGHRLQELQGLKPRPARKTGGSVSTSQALGQVRTGECQRCHSNSQHMFAEFRTCSEIDGKNGVPSMNNVTDTQTTIQSPSCSPPPTSPTSFWYRRKWPLCSSAAPSHVSNHALSSLRQQPRSTGSVLHGSGLWQGT